MAAIDFYSHADHAVHIPLKCFYSYFSSYNGLVQFIAYNCVTIGVTLQNLSKQKKLFITYMEGIIGFF